MGVSINAHVYKVGPLLSEIEHYVTENGGYREGALPVREWFPKIASEFGAIEGDIFLSVWNEYYEDYNGAYEFCKAVTRYYFPQADADEDTFWTSNYYTVEGGNADEALESLFPEEFGYEGKFTQDE